MINLKIFIVMQALALFFYLLRYSYKVFSDSGIFGMSDGVCKLVLYLGSLACITLGTARLALSANSSFAGYSMNSSPIVVGILLFILTVTGVIPKFLDWFYSDIKRLKLLFFTMSTILATLISLIGFVSLFGEPLP